MCVHAVILLYNIYIYIHFKNIYITGALPKIDATKHSCTLSQLPALGNYITEHQLFRDLVQFLQQFLLLIYRGQCRPQISSYLKNLRLKTSLWQCEIPLTC